MATLTFLSDVCTKVVANTKYGSETLILPKEEVIILAFCENQILQRIMGIAKNCGAGQISVSGL